MNKKICTKKPLTELLADIIIYQSSYSRIHLGKNKRKENQKYYCYKCQAWHTTSKPFKKVN